MKTEQSAGGIVIRNNKVLMIRDMNGVWTFPKGKIEKGESLLAAAKREVREETGVYPLKKLKKLTPIRYTFKRNGEVNKSVTFFLFETDYQGTLIPQNQEGISQVKWAPLEKVKTLAGYPDTQWPLIEEVKSCLR